MTKNFRTVEKGIVLGILLVSVIVFIPTPDTIVSADSESTKLISFHSYIDFDYNLEALNKPLAIDVSVTIPVTISFWTDIPGFFEIIPFPFNYLILYGQSIGPMQTIHLEVLNPPDWANIYISSPDVLTDIPFESQGKKQITTNLILSPRVEAPATSYKIDIIASCDAIKRLNGYTYSESVEFTPSFIPTIQITPENPIRTVGPHQSINFKINVMNGGNKITRVTPTLIGADDEWIPTINPPEYEISPKAEATFTFSIITPKDFGWHNEYGKFEINFKSEVYPYRTGAANNSKSIYLVVNNYGFSTPGFEFPILIVALMAMGIIIQKRRNR